MGQGEGIAQDASGNTYLAGFLNNSSAVAEYAPSGTLIDVLSGAATGLSTPQGIFISGSDLYVVNSASVTEYALPLTGCSGTPPICNQAPVATLTGSATGLTNPFGISVDASGNIWVANASSITEYAPLAPGTDNTAPEVTLTGAATGLAAPNYAVVHGNTLFVDNAHTSPPDTITEYSLPLTGCTGTPNTCNTPPTVTISGANTGLNNPSGMVFDASGNLFVVNANATSVTEYTPGQYGTSGDPTPVNTIAGSNTGLANPQFIVLEQPPSSTLSITTTSPLPGATQNSPYTETLAAMGGAPPYTWSLATGSTVPAGLTLSAGGVISGTPTASGTSSFTVDVADSATPAHTASKAFSLTVNPEAAPLSITTTSPLPGATQNSPYTETLAAMGGAPPYTWSLATGSTVPAGLTLSAGGVISGTPTASGTSSFTVDVADSATPAHTASKAFSLTVNPAAAPLSITTTSPLPAATVNSPYSTTLTATGGTGPYTWSLASGSTLPAGLTLTPDGTISGTPTAQGTSTFTVDVADSANPPNTASKAFSLTVGASQLVITTTSLPAGTVGRPYTATLAATGGTSPDIWTLDLSSAPLPAGLTLSPAGVISGTPTQAGTNTNLTFHVTDSSTPPQTANASIALTINEGPPFVPGSVVAWGYGAQGTLGNGTTPTNGNDAPNPVSLPPGTIATAISAGNNTGYAVTSAGDVYAWGGNNSGQLGNGSTDTKSATPVQVCAVGGCANGFLSGITSISAGDGFAVAVTSSGHVVAWGDNSAGELGNGTSTPGGRFVNIPAYVCAVGGCANGNLSGIKTVSAGSTHVLAVTTTGAVLAWGGNSNGQVGNGTVGQFLGVNLPGAVCAVGGCANGNLSGISSVSGGDTHSLAVTTAGAVLAWGNNITGQLGNGTTTQSLTPMPVSIPAGDTVTFVAAGFRGSFAVTSTGSVLSWGFVNGGSLVYPGLGNGDTAGSTTPVALSLPGVKATAVSTQFENAMILTSTGRVLAWGSNDFGQLGQGNGSTDQSLTPIPVVMPAGTTISAISAGTLYNLALVGTPPPTGPAIVVSPASGPPTTTISVSGSGFAPNKAVGIYFDTTEKALTATNAKGTFTNVGVKVPADAVPGGHFVTAVVTRTGQAAQASFTVDTPWAQFGDTANRSRFNPFEKQLSPSTAPGLVERWRFAAGDLVGSSPAEADGSVYVGSNDHHLYAVDATTGTQRWAFDAGDKIISSPAVAGGLVYVGSGRLYAVDTATGIQRWSFDAGGKIASSPAVSGGLVYVTSQGGSIFAVDAITGAQRWTFATGAPIFSSPAVANGVVYVGSNSGSVYAFNAATGAKVWSFPTGNVVASSPAVVNGVVYVGSNAGNLYALNSTTGAMLWLFHTGADMNSSPAVANGMVYVGSNTGKVVAIDAYSGKKRWAFNTGNLIASSPAVANGVVYVGSNNGYLYALRASTGARLFADQTGGNVVSSPAIANGMVYVGSNSNNLIALGLPSATTKTSHPALKVAPKPSQLRPNPALKP